MSHFKFCSLQAIPTCATMKAFVFVLALAIVQIKAKEISSNCLHGITDASTCCEGVPPLQDVLLRNPNNCGTYLQCVHGVPMERPCPAGLHWSVSANRCEWPHLAGCEGAAPSEQPNHSTAQPSRPTEARPSTPTDGCGNVAPTPPEDSCIAGETSADICCQGVPYWQDVLLPNPADCGSYIQCVHEKPMVRPCPSGLHWSIAANRCEWPNIAKCNGDEGENNGGIGSTPGPGEGVLVECQLGSTKHTPEECCKGVPYDVDVLFKNPADCGTYYQCVHEKPMVRPCPAGLHWGVQQNRCEWKDIAKCEEKNVIYYF